MIYSLILLDSVLIFTYYIKYIYLISLLIKALSINSGVGIALNQLNYNYNCFITLNYYNNYLVYLNSTISWCSLEFILNKEACLSINNYIDIKNRFKYIIINILCIDNVVRTFYISNFFSICIQHELMHLKGILIN